MTRAHQLALSGEIEGTRLLLVGNESEMLELLEEVLSDVGFSVDVSDILENVAGKITTSELNVVICDEVAGETDGEKVYADFLVSPQAKTSAFILLGDDPDGERIKRCLVAGMTDYLSKPFDIDELDGRIRKAIRTQRIANQALALDEGDDEVGFQGKLSSLGLPDLLMNLHQNTRDGKLVVTVDEGEYIFEYLAGKLVRVSGPRGLAGRKALFRAMREVAGDFRFVVTNKIKKSKSQSFDNLANVILQAVQEADEFPLYRNKLPSDPVAVMLSTAAGEPELEGATAIQPLLEGLLQSTTIDILIHACPKTDLQAAMELQELMDGDVLIVAGAAEASA